MTAQLRQWICPSDLVQDAISEVVSSGREPEHPRPLVATIAHRRLIDAKRRHWRSAANPVHFEIGVDPVASDPADLAEAEDLKEALFAAASEDVRAVIRGRLEGYTMPEIATQEGCTVRTLERRMREFRDQNRGLE